jgi:hypothetical protein
MDFKTIRDLRKTTSTTDTREQSQRVLREFSGNFPQILEEAGIDLLSSTGVSLAWEDDTYDAFSKIRLA